MSDLDYTHDTILKNLRELEQLATAGLTATQNGMPELAPAIFQRLAEGIEQNCVLLGLHNIDPEALRSNGGSNVTLQQ